MCRYIETVRIENGELHNVERHNMRMNAVRKEVWGTNDCLKLEDYVQAHSYKERTRCRVTYGMEIESVEYFPYQIRPVHSLQLVDGGDIDYRMKHADRTDLNELFSHRSEADEILIVRNGLLTDTSIANIALWDGSCWYTPALPLLGGTQRAYLLDQGIISTRNIRVEELSCFQKIRMFNAMIDFGEVETACNNIKIFR